MKHFLYISTLILLYLLTCSKGCDNGEQRKAERQQIRIKNEIDSVTTVFSRETLLPETLRAFEETAKTNFSDLFDYIKIASDTNTAPAFRDHARKMILNQFVSNSNVFTFSLDDESRIEEISLNNLLENNSLNLEYLSLIQPDSLWFIHDLNPVNDSVFGGQMGFTYVSLAEQIKQENHFLGTGYVEVWIEKRSREFGDDTLKVWSTYFGNVKFMN